MKILRFIGLILLVLVVLAALLLYKSDIPTDVVDAKYSTAASQFMELDDAGRIHYRDEGRRRDFPVVLLHGSNASLHTWEPWVDRLSKQYRVVTLDLPGHGLTGAVPAATYSTEAYIDVVKSVLQNLGITRFVLAGNSMGGGVAWRYALAHPAPISTIWTMIGSACTGGGLRIAGRP